MWKDTTSYSRGEVRIPTTWSLDRGGLRITVTCGHIYYKNGEWVMHCAPWFDTHLLEGACSAEEAQSSALKLVTEKIEKLHAAFAA